MRGKRKAGGVGGFRLARSLRPALVCLALGFPAAAPASDFSASAVGTAGSEFLNFDLGARGIAMGGAYSAASDDANSLYWNPAGLAKIPRLSAAFMYSTYAQNINYQSGSYAQRVNDDAVAAVGVRYQDLGPIDQTDISGNGMGSFHPRNYVAEVGWGESLYDLSDNEISIDAGVTGRWIHSVITEQANGYAGDIGVQARIMGGWLDYDLAALVQNIGVGQKFDQTRNTLPTRAKIGAAVKPLPGLLLDLDAIAPANNAPGAALGAEYAWEVQKEIKAMLRAGCNTLTISSLGAASAFSAGLGLTIRDFTFDYAFTPMGVLGYDSHRFSISYNLPAKSSRRYNGK